MSCRRAFEVDVPAFVLDPRDPAWDEFRAHYPRCAACAAEVAAWSALQATLAERHPEPEDLLRWSDTPDTLAAEARAAISRHVERCASCRDELRALGAFAGAAAAASPSAAAAASATRAADGAVPAAAPTGSGAKPTAHEHHPSASRPGGRRGERHAFARRGSVSGAAHGGTQAADDRPAARRGPVARVLLHPALAYAVLALVLLLPTVRAALDRDAGRAAFDAASEVASDPSSEVAASDVSLPGIPASDAGPPQVAEQAPRPLQDVAPAAAPARQLAEPAPRRDGGASADARPITEFARAQHDADSALAEPSASLDDAQVDHTAPRLVRQAPARPAAPAAAAPAPALADSARVGPAAERLEQAVAPPAGPARAAPVAERLEQAAAPLAAGVPVGAAAGAVRASAAKSTALRASDERRDDARAGDGGTRDAHSSDARRGGTFRLLPAAPDGTRDLVVALPPSLADGALLEVRIVDASGGRELRQRVAGARHAGTEVRVPLPAGFTAPVLRVEVYAGGADPLLQGSVAP